MTTWTQEKKDKLGLLRARGLSAKEIGLELGCSEASVFRQASVSGLTGDDDDGLRLSADERAAVEHLEDLVAAYPDGSPLRDVLEQPVRLVRAGRARLELERASQPVLSSIGSPAGECAI